MVHNKFYIEAGVTEEGLGLYLQKVFIKSYEIHPNYKPCKLEDKTMKCFAHHRTSMKNQKLHIFQLKYNGSFLRIIRWLTYIQRHSQMEYIIYLDLQNIKVSSWSTKKAHLVNAFLWKSKHPSAEILITLWDEHHEQTTNRMNLWQKVSCSSKKNLTFPDGEFCKVTLKKGAG